MLAILSSASYATVAVIDKRLIDRHMPSLSSYFLWIAIAVLIYGLAFMAVDGVPLGVPTTHLLIAGISGLCWGGAMALMFWGFKLQEVSRASAVLFTFPVFVALMATTFLGETLATEQWIAIAVVVWGAFLISLTSPSASIFLKTNRYWDSKDSSRSRRIRLTLAFPILMGASLLTALGHLTGKYALQELSVWQVTSMNFFGTAAILVYLLQPQSFGQLLHVMQKKEALLLLLVSECVLIPIAVVSMITATKLGPVSLVATLTGTRPLFIFFYGTILSLPGIRILNESLDRKSLALKLASVVLIISGILSL